MGSITRLPVAAAERLAGMPYSYPEVGATRQHRLPDGYRRLCLQTQAGTGRDRFVDLADRLMRWQLHADSGLDIATSSDTARPGTVLVATYRLAGIPVRTRCRVLYVIDEPRRRGFAYGSLPGHPLRGEESFVVDWRDDDTVDFTVRSFAQPAGAFPRLGGPVTRLVRRRINQRYLDAARR